MKGATRAHAPPAAPSERRRADGGRKRFYASPQPWGGGGGGGGVGAKIGDRESCRASSPRDGEDGDALQQSSRPAVCCVRYIKGGEMAAGP